MNKLTRNQIIAILVFGVVLLGGALAILSNRPTTDDQVVTTTEQVDATAVAQSVPTDEPESTPAPTPIRETRSDDTDGDGVPNDGTDQCPDVFGDAAFGGCPNPDTDGDGIDDSKEPAGCVGAPDAGFGIDGSGCPLPDPNTVNDDDGDGFVNASDSCPTQGDAGFGVDGSGCPLPDPNTVNDDDGDGFVNANDACPTQGSAGFGVDGSGCPLPDPNTVNDDDGDGFVNASDSCPTQGDAGFGIDGSGCPNPAPQEPDRPQNRPQGDEWDRSSVSVSGECAGGIPTFYVTNTGDAGEGDMDAPTSWRLTNVNTGEVIASGSIQVAGGQTQSLSFPEFAGLSVRLNVDQRPGHPGFSEPNAVVENCGVAPTEEPTVEVVPTEDPTVEVVPTDEPTVEVVPTDEPTPDVTPTEEPTPVVTPPSVPSSGNFSSSIVCNHNNGTVTFTVTNNGSAMAQGVSYPVTYSTTGRNAQSNVSAGNVQRLGAGASQTFTVRSQSGNTITFTVGELGLSQTIECWDKSSVSVSGACVNNIPTFTVNNTGTEGMTAPTTWRVTDVNTGQVILTGTIQLSGSGSETLTFPQFSGMTIRLNVDQRPGHPGSSQPNAVVNSSCGVPVTPEVTPTEEPTVDVTPTEEPTVDVTPTEEPTVEPTPTEDPTVEPTPTEDLSDPSYDSSIVCNHNNGTVTFTVVYTGTGSMPQGVSYPVTYTVNGATSSAGNVSGLSDANTTQTFTVRGQSGNTITFNVADLGLSQTVECWDKSSVSVDGECVNGVITFYVSNTGSQPMSAPTTWRLEDANGQVLTTGTIQLGGSETRSVTFPEFDGQTLRLWVDQRPGHPGFSQPNASVDSCSVPSVYTPSGYCDVNGTFGFTISHTGGIGSGVSFTVSDGNTTLDSGTLSHDEAANFNRTYTSTANSLIFTVTNNDNQVVKVHTQPNCYTAPEITLDGYCEANGVTFFSASVIGSPLGSFSYTVTDQNGGTVASGDLSELLAGITYTGDYSSLTLSVSGTTDPVSVNPKTVSNCYTTPEYVVDVYCAQTNGEYVVTISDNGVPPLPGTTVEYEIITTSGGVPLTPYTTPVNQNVTGQSEVTVNVYVNGELVASDSASCYVAPRYVVSAECTGNNGEYSFFAQNIGGTPVTGDVPTFSVTDENGTEVRSGEFSQLPITITGPYSSLTITMTTSEGDVEYTTNSVSCYNAPVLVASAVCADQNGGYIFNVVNNGGSLVSGSVLPNYSITDNNGTELASGTVSLPFFPVTLVSENAPLTMSFFDGTISIESVTTPGDCFQAPAFEPNVYCGDNGVFIVSIVNNGGLIVETKPTYEIFVDGFSMGVVEFDNADLPINQTVTDAVESVSVTVSFNGSSVEASNDTCYSMPEYTPDGYCGENGQYFFSLAQTGGGAPTTGIEPTFSITGNGFSTLSGSMSSLSGYMPIVGQYEDGLTMTVFVSEGLLTIEAPITIDCYEAPVYTSSAFCGENGEFFFLVSLVGGGTPIGAEPTFTIQAVGNPPYSASGNISQLPASITGRYSLVTLTVTTTEGTVSQQAEPLTTCYTAPEYVPTVECTGNNGEFVVNVVNVGGEPVGGGVNILVGLAVVNGGGASVDLIENAVLPFSRTYTGPYQYVDVSVSSPDVEIVTAINEDCYNPPVYAPYVECAEGQNGVFNFGFTNTGGAPITPESVSFTVTDENGTVLVQDSQFSPYDSSVSGTYNSVTLTIDSTQVSETVGSCYTAPQYVAQLICADSVNGTFNGQIFNIGGTSDDVLTYSIFDSQNNEIASGSVDSLPFTIPPFNSTATGLTLFVYVNGDSIGTTAEAGACYVEPPSFDSSLICENNGTAVFTISVLTGELGDNTYPVIYTVDGNAQSAGTFSADNTEFSVRGMSGKTITFSVVGLDSLTKTVECWDKSSVSVDGICLDGVITFYVSNTGSEPMSAPTTWRLEDANGTVLTSGTIQLAGNETRAVTFPEFDGQTLRLWVDQRPGHPGFSQPNASVDSCAVPSVYTPSGYCAENGTFGFTIAHTGGIGSGVSFTVSNGNTILDSGTLSHDEAANFNRTYISTANSLIFTVTNTDSQVVKVHTQPNCYTAPEITLNGYCEGNGITAFSASVSGSPLSSFIYTIVDQNGNTVASGDLSELFAGVTYTGDYASLTLSVSGDVDPVSVNPKTVSNCYTAPEYDVDAFCYKSADNGAFAVSIEDNGYTPLPNTTVTYEVVDQNGTVLESGNYNGGGYFSPFVGYTSITINLYVNGELVDTATSTECYNPPVYVADGFCDYRSNGAYVFTASNIGGAPLTTEATFEIVDENGTQVASGNISQLAGLMPIIGTYNSLSMTLFTSEGTIDRQADTLTCYQPPVLEATGICADQNGGFSFSVINTGGAVINGVTLPNYSITDANGTELASGTVTIPFTTVNVTSENAPVTMSFSGGDIVIDPAVSPSDCFQPPAFEPNVYCGEENGVFVVSIVNTGGAIVSTLPSYEIFIDGASQGAVEFSANVNLPLPAGKYGNVSVTVTYGDTTVSADNSDCYRQPEYTPTGYCGTNGQFFFTLTQTGGGTPVDGGQPTFEITGDGFTTVSGNMNQLAGLMPIVGVYENGLTMTVTTSEGILTNEAPITIDCYEAPVWTPTAVCGDANGLFLFDIQLVSGTPITGEEPTYTIETVGNPAFSDSGAISQLPASITGRYSSVTLTIKTTEGSVSAQAEPLTTCYNPPVYVPSVECTSVNGEFTVNVVNTGGMPVGGNVTIVVDFAVINGGGVSLEVIENAQLPFNKTYTGPYQFVGVSVSSPDVEPVFANNDTCYNPPVYVPEVVCGEENGTFNFSISNVGGAPIEPELVDFTLWDENFDQIMSDSQFPPYSGSISGTYQSVTLMIDRTETSATVENCYTAPEYVAELFCLDATTSTYGGQISNIGGASNDSLFYQVVDAGNVIVIEGTVDALPFTLPTFSSTSTSVTLFVYVGESIATFADAGDCVIIVTPTPTPEVTPTPDVTPTPEPTPVVTPEEPVCGETFETPDGQITINLDMCNPDPEIGVPSWSPIEIGGAICPDWLVYHTNMTGDWELFRLGDLPNGLDGDENLSRGVGVDVYDLAPSRSPDGMWVAFASTRDSIPGSRARNWEVYVSNVVTNDIRRITYNEFAMDLDPVWSPNGLKLAYETTTGDGDWEIRIFDLLTGENINVTNSNTSNDINPSWSPDGTKLLIQSDRADGLWQIYEIDLANGNAVTRLSDGTGDDHDPMYSNDGTKIVFRSYRDDPRPENDRSRQSSVYYMNTDGTGVTRVSDLGGNATNHVFSPDDTLIAYQSNIAGGINDIYVYEIATGLTRLLTNNTGDYANIQDTAPTWYCESTMLVFTSSVDATVDNPNNTNVFMVNALPIDAPPINADEDATRLTDDEEIDRDAQNSPSEENASRYGQVPPKWTP